MARKLATLDALTGGGRVAIHHITGGDEADQQRDGDFTGHDRRYARTGEFMSLLRRELTATEPFGLSLGDRSCLALAIALNAPVYTTEQSWRHLKLGVPIHVIR